MSGLEARVYQVEKHISDIRVTVAHIDSTLPHLTTKAQLVQVEGNLREQIAQTEGNLREQIAQTEGNLKEQIAQIAGVSKADITQIHTILPIFSTKEQLAQVEGNLKAEIAKINAVLPHLATKKELACLESNVKKTQYIMGGIIIAVMLLTNPANLSLLENLSKIFK